MKRRLTAALVGLAAVLAPAAVVWAKGFDARPPAEVLEAYARAQRALTADEHEAAQRDLEWVLERAPDFGPAYGLYKDLFNRNMDGRKAAAEKYRKLAASEPDRAAWWYAVGRLGVDTDERRKAFERVVALDPGSPWGHYGMGLIGEIGNDRAAAVAGYEKAHKIAPDEPSIAAALASAYVDAGRLADAVKVLEAVAKAHPASYWTEQAFVPVVSTEEDAAKVARARQYLGLFPRGRYSVMAHAIVLDNMMNADTAAAAAKAREAIAALPGARYAGGRARLFRDYVLARAVEEGQASVDKLAAEVLASKEDASGVYAAIGERYVEAPADAATGIKLFTRAHEAATAAKAGAEAIDDIRYGLGRLYLRTNEPRRAAEHLSAITSEGLVPSAGFALGEAHEKLGEPAAAYDAYVRAVAAEPSPERSARLAVAAKATGKSREEANAAVWAVRDKAAKPSTPFTLTALDGKEVSLSDYRGKVVLLNFWFPG